jgi:hypothetical protein
MKPHHVKIFKVTLSPNENKITLVFIHRVTINNDINDKYFK